MFHAFVVVCAQSEKHSAQLENFFWCGKCRITTCKARNSMSPKFAKVKKKKKNIMRVNETEHERESSFIAKENTKKKGYSH